ncbi:MAG: phosphoglucosamine mutase [Candidatus Methylumidiphilus alinenensis]|uniref:Phosphoglucosamine mutase n=1 Tax=Candidatus Methylumidiphilus alinenensis TaxID=2202197 RepID=A0A2W4R7B9_9GAMM|nr:MAG: phosphoglucosamine mutase [Candidatus Methylumidiphilus alinenensis]
MKKTYFGTDGVRGKVGEYPITPDFMLKLGWAAGKVFAQAGSHNNVVIGKDTRISGYMFESALEAGLSAAGVNTQLLGPMPTPAIAYLTRTFRARAGIVISASHNPYYDNGIKFFSQDGMKLPDEIEFKIEEQLDLPMTTVESSRLGKATRIEDAAGRYIEFCKSTIPSAIDFNGYKVVVDCANGSTYHVAPPVFRELGAEVVKIGVEPNGLNINEGVGATQPEKLQQTVLAERANFGIALDGDGDRLIMVDEQGIIVDGDELVYIIARSRLHVGQLRGPVVGTLMSNLGMERALEDLGIVLKRAAVGDRYVMEMMQQFDSVLGGESSGHIICRDRTSTGDGIIAALQVMTEMKQTGKTLSELKQGMEKYPQKLLNVKIREKVNINEIPSIVAAKEDAERELGKTGRVLLRSSGTEPLIRVMVEGRDAGQVECLAQRLADVVTEALAA